VLTLGALVIWLAVAPAPADAYYEEFFCDNAVLAPREWCGHPHYHHLAKVNANAFSGGAYVCAYSQADAGWPFSPANSDPKCADGFVEKLLNGTAGHGACFNGEGYTMQMDYCVQKF
jgi:hypothetical protein